CETGDARYERLGLVDGKAACLLEGSLAGSLAREMARVVMRRNIAVSPGAPLVIVDPVDDAVEVFFSRPQYAVEARSKLSGLDLLAVSLAHRVEEIGKDDAPL